MTFLSTFQSPSPSLFTRSSHSNEKEQELPQKRSATAVTSSFPSPSSAPETGYENDTREDLNMGKKGNRCDDKDDDSSSQGKWSWKTLCRVSHGAWALFALVFPLIVVVWLYYAVKRSLATTTMTTIEAIIPSDTTTAAPQWMYKVMAFRKALFLQTIEPVIVTLLGPVVPDHHHDHNYDMASSTNHSMWTPSSSNNDTSHRRLNFLPSYISHVEAFHETSMSFATLIMLFLTLSAVFLVSLACFFHNQKTSPLFVSPRRHRLPKLVPPPLPVDGYFSWIPVCFYLSDEEIIHRIGYDSLIFLRFHRLALRCIVKMSVFSFVVLLPLNFTAGGHAKAQDLKQYVGSLFFTDFLRFTMANVMPGSLKLWVHCFAAYLLTAIVVRELLVEYETFNSIRHRYLLSREPHLRTVLVTNIPRNLRSSRKITSYFQHVYPNGAVKVRNSRNSCLYQS